MVDLAKLNAQLKGEEQLRLTVYDDATGQPIVPGYTVIGHPTIGWGRLLDRGHGVTKREADDLFSNDVTEAITDCALYFVCWRRLVEVRQRVLVDLRFNLGLNGLRSFRRMIDALEGDDYKTAAAELMHSDYARQLGDGYGGRLDRPEKLARMLETGHDIGEETVA